MRVCFVSEASYDVICKGGANRTGGAENQQYLLAQGLGLKGVETCYIIGDHAQPDVVHSPVGKAYKLKKRKRPGLKGLRLLNYWWALVKAMIKTNADVFYLRGNAGNLLLICALFCRIARKKLIYSTSREADVNNSNYTLLSKMALFDSFYYIGLHLSHSVLVQHTNQKEQMDRKYGVKSIVLMNGVDLPEKGNMYVPYDKPKRPMILFLGRFHAIKQPHLFVGLAEGMPKYDFVLCGMLDLSEYSDTVLKQASEIENLSITGVILPDKVRYYLNRSALLVNTSESEGFPNAFLEAWAYKVPVVSLNVDPGGLMKANRLGDPCHTLAEMKNRIEWLIENEEERRLIGIRCRDYVEKNHNIENIVEKFIRIVV